MKEFEKELVVFENGTERVKESNEQNKKNIKAWIYIIISKNMRTEEIKYYYYDLKFYTEK